MKWSQTEVETSEGLKQAIAPEIISVSRSTDIPAFYAEWFMNRLREGYVKWMNPFNRSSSYVSFNKARAIVFWSKNPRPLMAHLSEIDSRGIRYYFHFTLNDYQEEKLEPCVPPLAERIQTFIDLSNTLGKEKVIWRFDPLILLKNLDIEGLLSKVRKVGDKVARYTTKLVFSFADISAYKKVQNSLNRNEIEYQEFDKDKMKEIATEIAKLCNKWGIAAATCGEHIDLSKYAIQHNKCIDDELILKITQNDPSICRLFGMDISVQGDLFSSTQKETKKKLKDPGQRKDCGCVFSKDIGQYNTCPHLCLYCYANNSKSVVQKNHSRASEESDSIIGK
ncbi:DUF1848 domain-containing protein [Planctomycetota bacterium]